VVILPNVGSDGSEALMRVVNVDLGERRYPIRIGCDLPVGLSLDGGGPVRTLLVSDSTVVPLYGRTCGEKLAAHGAQVTCATVPAGESSKDLGRLAELYDEAIRAGLDRASVVVALGGGVIGDLAGFAAATYMRGIGLIQVPTTLLAMVDSSVGGKTAVNLPAGKNLVGAFHQPIEVVADLLTLETLPDRDYVSGLAEVVKYGVIWDAVFFEMLERNADKLKQRDVSVLEEVIGRCCEIKADIVAMDERESGVRAILNYGHTFGHALEKVCGFGQWLHGEAVSMGMVYAARLSAIEKGFAAADVERLTALLRAFNLPTTPRGTGDDVDWAAVRVAMQGDKKAQQSVPRFVLSEKIGAVVFGCKVPESSMTEAF